MPKEVRYPKSESARSNLSESDGDSAFWGWGDDETGEPMALREGRGANNEQPPDLMERTARFGEAIIRFVKKVPRGSQYPENNRLVDQLVGAGTSIGANYCEADDAVSGKDYRNKIGICRKESKETMFFLRMMAATEDSLAEEAKTLWREAKELNLIFGSIWRKRS